MTQQSAALFTIFLPTEAREILQLVRQAERCPELPPEEAAEVDRQLERESSLSDD